jgi:catechol 2,3-dioxygenase-like lactoylglutathione lyase family enzyme
MPDGRKRPLRPSLGGFVVGADAAHRARRDEGGIAMTSRVQLALNVTDIDAATAFYEQLFGVKVAKQRPGYANFVIADPPLKLVLFEDPTAVSPLNHLGVEVPTPHDVVAASERFSTAGLTHTMASADRCCHAVQDKVWVDAPDVPLGGWEFYTVLADDPGQAEAGAPSVCCGGSASAAESSCCSTTGER